MLMRQKCKTKLKICELCKKEEKEKDHKIFEKENLIKLLKKEISTVDTIVDFDLLMIVAKRKEYNKNFR